MSDHPRIEEAIAAMVIDPAGAAEHRTEVLDHLAGCETCQRLYRELREVAGDLAIAATPLALSSAVEDRVMTAIRGDRRDQTPARAPRRGRARALIAAATVAVVASATLNVTLLSRLDDARTEARALAIVTSPEADLVRMRERGGPGVVTVGILDDGRAALVGNDLRAPAGQVLELWIQRGRTMVPVVAFRPTDGRAALTFAYDPARDVAVAITIEDGFVQAPTKDPIFIGALET